MAIYSVPVKYASSVVNSINTCVDFHNGLAGLEINSNHSLHMLRTIHIGGY